MHRRFSLKYRYLQSASQKRNAEGRKFRARIKSRHIACCTCLILLYRPAYRSGVSALHVAGINLWCIVILFIAVTLTNDAKVSCFVCGTRPLRNAPFLGPVWARRRLDLDLAREGEVDAVRADNNLHQWVRKA